MIKAKEFLRNFLVYKPKNLIQNPLISIIMPTFCRGNNGLLERSIQSVLNQSFTNFEFIIVDDGSVDQTSNIIKSFLEKDNRIIYIRNEINSELPAIRTNQGICQARGKYLAYQFDDDYWLPNFLNDLYTEIESKNDECLVYGKTKLINKLSNHVDYFQAKPNAKLLQTRNLFANNSVLYHKSLCDKYGMYDMHLFAKTGCDWDLWQRYIKHVPFYYVDKLVSVVESFHNNSIGKECKYHKGLYTLITSKDRTSQLTPDNYGEYVIDDLDFIEDFTLKETLYHHHILPWKNKHRNTINEDIIYSLRNSEDTSLVRAHFRVGEKSYIDNQLNSSDYICYVMHSGHIGGAENHLLRHALLSKDFGLNVIVCIPNKFSTYTSDVGRICAKNDIPLEYLDFNFYISPYNIDTTLADKQSHKILQFLKDHKVKLVHSCTLMPAFKVACNGLDIPYVASLYGIPPENQKHTTIIDNTYLPDVIHSDSIRYTNEWGKILDTYSKCIRSFTPDKFFNKDINITFGKKSLNLIICGTLQERKRQAELIEAVGLLKKENINMNLKIVGYTHFRPSFMERCKQLIEKYDLSDNITFTGFTNNVEKEMEDINVLVCTSDFESFPQVILEGMAKKILILSTPVGGVPELIINNYSGYLCVGFSVEDIADALRQIDYDYRHNIRKIKGIVNTASELVKKESNGDLVLQELFLLYSRAYMVKKNNPYKNLVKNIRYTSLDGYKK